MARETQNRVGGIDVVESRDANNTPGVDSTGRLEEGREGMGGNREGQGRTQEKNVARQNWIEWGEEKPPEVVLKLVLGPAPPLAVDLEPIDKKESCRVAAL